MACYTGSIGSGKTFILSIWALLRASQGRRVLLLEPTYPAVRDVLFPTLREVAEILGIKPEFKLSPMTNVYYGKGEILCRSGDRPDGLRGINADDFGADELSYQKEATYLVALGRVRRSANAQIRLVGSPKGMDWVYKMVRKTNCPNFKQTIYENFFLPKEYIEDLEKQYTGDFAKQELLGEVVDFDGHATLISRKVVRECIDRDYIIHDDDRRIAALDMARFGDDNTCFTVRKGFKLETIETWSKMDNVQIANIVSERILAQKIEVLAVDGTGGYGGGVIDILTRQIGNVCEIVEYNSSFKASDPHYFNLRAEVWCNMRDWLNSANIPDDERLLEDLTSLEYFYNTSNGKLQLEGKEQLKKRGLPSPDTADSLSMTFYAERFEKAKESARPLRAGFIG